MIRIISLTYLTARTVRFLLSSTKDGVLSTHHHIAVLRFENPVISPVSDAVEQVADQIFSLKIGRDSKHDAVVTLTARKAIVALDWDALAK